MFGGLGLEDGVGLDLAGGAGLDLAGGAGLDLAAEADLAGALPLAEPPLAKWDFF